MYPTLKRLEEIAQTAGGHLPDAIAPAVCVDWILWDDSTGEVTVTTRIASDDDNIAYYPDNIRLIAKAWKNAVSVDELIAGIASHTCPYMTADYDYNCPCNKYGYGMCKTLIELGEPLCEHEQHVKRLCAAAREES